jgi:hypothetical protein
MLRKLKRLQMRLNDPIFSLWNRQKNSVFERGDLSLLSRAAARLDELNHLLIGPFFFSREWQTQSAGGNHCL